MSHPSNRKKTEVSAELIRFPSSLWTPWVFHTSVVVCDCLRWTLMRSWEFYVSQKTSHCLWFLRIKLTFGAANCHYPELLPHDAHLTWKISSKTCRDFCHKKKSSQSALRQSASPMWQDLNQSCDGKMMIFQTNWKRKLPRDCVKNKNTQVSNVKAGNHVCLFLAPKRICLKACWWVQR